MNVANATEHYVGALVVVHVIHFLYSPEGGSYYKGLSRDVPLKLFSKSASWYNNDPLLIQCKNWYKHGSYFLKLAQK